MLVLMSGSTSRRVRVAHAVAAVVAFPLSYSEGGGKNMPAASTAEHVEGTKDGKAEEGESSANASALSSIAPSLVTDER